MKSLLLLLVGAGFAAPFVADAAPLAGTPVPAPVTLQVAVTNVRGSTGRVHVDLCLQKEFLKNCQIFAEAKAVKGTTVVTIANVPPGDYAAQITYDENGNGKVDRGLFGIPKEGVGFSRDAPIRLGPPRWQDAVVAVTADRTITARLRYF